MAYEWFMSIDLLRFIHLEYQKNCNKKYDKAKEKCRQLEDELKKTRNLNEILFKKNQENEFQIVNK
ncbi:unnamed protein product [Paramecium primaurelia]|uniref:Uncharacterized protein n=1 Tax=Paramecium primaurelia TaxID=5886 RepID=A0A8S1MPH5_PARPR|nr:unnamed protein product [Paramecium primaurelia]